METVLTVVYWASNDAHVLAKVIFFSPRAAWQEARGTVFASELASHCHEALKTIGFYWFLLK